MLHSHMPLAPGLRGATRTNERERCLELRKAALQQGFILDYRCGALCIVVGSRFAQYPEFGLSRFAYIRPANLVRAYCGEGAA